MTNLRLLTSTAVVVCLAGVATAAPIPPPKARTPITAENADKVRSSTELEKAVYRIRLGPGRGELTFLDWNNAVEVVDDVNFRTLRKIAKDHRPTDFAASPDGKLLTWTERDKSIYFVQEAASGKTFEINAGKSPGYAAFSPDGKLIAIGDTVVTPQDPEGGGYSEMKLWDVSGKLVRTLDKSGQGALTPRFSPDGKILAVGNRNRETRLFDVATGKLLHTLDRRMTQEIAFSPDGKTLAAGYVDGAVALWDVKTGKLLHEQKSGCKEIYSVDWTPKGDVLATSGRDGPIILWETQKLTRLKELEAPFWVIQARFTADGSRLLTSSASDYGSRDRKVVIWAVPDGK